MADAAQQLVALTSEVLSEAPTLTLPELVELLQTPPHSSRWYLVCRRLLDVVFASILLVCVLPLCIFIAIAIKVESPGGVFFRQQRLGHRLRCFTILKFRTMHRNASATPVAVYDPETGSYRRPRSAEDPRVTKMGFILRRFSLDELPQLINILVGDMSFIGPRPLALNESLSVPKAAIARYTVPCGITGLAQIRDRHTLVSSRRFDNDIEYVLTMGPKVDFEIFLRTFARMYDRG